jgi:hypothetical protein
MAVAAALREAWCMEGRSAHVYLPPPLLEARVVLVLLVLSPPLLLLE